MSKKTVALWAPQLLLAAVFAMAGFMKATQPITDLAVIQVLAMGLHIHRSEFEVLPVSVVLLALAVFVMLGRRTAPSAATI